MKDEIKEILDNIKRQNEWEGIEYFKTPLSTEQANKLLDYITNLQKTQETLIKNDNEIITNLQEENKKLKELCNKYEEEHNTTFNYWKQLIKEDYKLKCEKAIEYMQNKMEETKNLQDYSKWYVENYDKAINLTNSSHSGIMLEAIKSTTIKRYKDVLNILKGENNDI